MNYYAVFAVRIDYLVSLHRPDEDYVSGGEEIQFIIYPEDVFASASDRYDLAVSVAVRGKRPFGNRSGDVNGTGVVKG